MDSSLNAYAVFTIFMQKLQFTIFATTKRKITVTTIVEGLKKKALGQRKGLQTRYSDITNPQKDDNFLNRMGGSVWSTIQKSHRIHQLEFLYASLWYLYVILYDYSAHNMLLQRSGFTWFYASQSLLNPLKEG